MIKVNGAVDERLDETVDDQVADGCAAVFASYLYHSDIKDLCKSFKDDKLSAT